MAELHKATEPPFDGVPCPMCPMELRNLAAVAHNLLAVWDDPGRQHKIPQRIEQLRRALLPVAKMVDDHFAVEAHSHGRSR